MLHLILAAQISTFVVMGIGFSAQGNLRLGIAQLLLAAFQAVIYSG